MHPEMIEAVMVGANGAGNRVGFVRFVAASGGSEVVVVGCLTFGHGTCA